MANSLNEIKSLSHSLVKHYVKLNQDSAYRKKEKSILIEGKKLVLEQLKRGPLKSWMTTKGDILGQNFPSKGYLVTSEILKKISATVTPEGIVAEIELPKFQNVEKAKKLLVLDRIQDPGNLGTLIRTAAALEWDAVYLLAGCCDPFNDKALRSSKGASLQIPLAFGNLQDLIELLKRKNFQVFAASLKGKELKQLLVEDKQLALILGNESHGVSKQLLDLFSEVTIPMSSEIDSLNAAIAGAILMYGFKERLNGYE